ncbi:MAG: iron ABC transporter permease [Chloroflexi bacterium]|nr:iron ABC transporter permease [Chloroflexota bacterium]
MQLSIPRPRLSNFRFDPRWIFLGVPVVVVAYFTVIPIGMLLVGAFKTGDPGVAGEFTFNNLLHAYADPTLYPLLLNSTIYAFGSSLLALVVGTALAWILERTDTPLKSLFYSLTLVPFIIPGVLHTIAWIYLLSPRIGFINRSLVSIFNLASPPFDVFTLGGMVWVEAMHLSPIVFVLMTAAFRSMDPALEEAATTAGANTWTTLRRVTLPLMLPALASVTLIMFIRGLESFEVPALIGLSAPTRIPVFTSRIYLALKGFPPDFGLASAYSLILIGLSVVGIYFYNRALKRSEKYATVSGKAYRPRTIELGKGRYVTMGLFLFYFFLIVGLPFFILLWGSVIPYFTPPALDMLDKLTLDNYAAFNILDCQPGQSFCLRARAAFTNSLMLGIGAATLVMVLTAIISWITVRTNWRGRGLLDLMAFLPITVPGLVMAVSLMWVYLTFRIGVYGTLWILLIAYITRFMPYGIRTTTATMVQIHRELEEAAQVAGASWRHTFLKITLPLLKPGLLAGWVYIVTVSMRELSTSVLLASSQSQVIAVMIFDMIEGGNTPRLAAMSVLFITFLIVLVFGAQKLGGRFGVRD